MAFIPESMFRNHVVDDHHHHNLYPAAGAAVPEFMMRRSMSFSGMDRAGPGEEFNPDEDGSDDGSSQLMLGEKKRRLNLEQVKALEKSFDSGNKLEPERKMQLARALGLQPRQIAIWFQNRRARWKTKQLEKDYDALRRQFEALKADNEALKSQNKSLRSQLVSMKSSDHHHRPINLNKDNEGSNWSNGSENSCEVNLNTNDHVVFPSPPPATTLTHFIHESTKINNNNNNNNINGSNSQTPPVSNEHCFGNVMFGGIEENPEFWPWPEQQNFQ